MPRMSHKQHEKVKDLYGTDRIWSYSRLSTFMEYPWIYMMNYLKKAPRSESCYTHWGTVAHGIMEDLYDKEIKYEDMIDIFEEEYSDWKFSGELEFPSDKIEDGYMENLRDYFQNTEVIPYEVKNEIPIMLVMEDDNGYNNVLVGYVDALYKDDDGVWNLVDYKTSSKSGFSGKKLAEKSQQLKLYAMGLSQKNGIPLSNIRMRFDMMKYLEVRYEQKNGKIGKFPKERRAWVQGMEKKLYKDLIDDDRGQLDPFEAEDMLQMSIMNNSIDNLPQAVQDLYSTHNYYIDITMDNEESDELEQLMIDTINDIRKREKGDWEKEFPEPKIHKGNEFFFKVLNPQLLKYHTSYQEQQDLIRAKLDDPNEAILDEIFN